MPVPISLQTTLHQLAAILNYAIFSSENFQKCWRDNINQSLHFTSSEMIYFFTPFLGSGEFASIEALLKGLLSVQSCLLQRGQEDLKEKTQDLKRERQLAEDLLHQMLPKSVAKQLRKCQRVEAENYDQVTIFFSDIVGFTSIAASCTPLQVVEMLNNLYICFDSRIESYDVYKVRTNPQARRDHVKTSSCS
uniref:guanylate cyclase n=1 Tax=Coturnix japonica TaxID=93934 RepID=A0A8C2T477_COTJA